MRTEDRVFALAEPICAALNCEIVDVEWQKEGADYYLRLFIDREEPVDHDICAAVSNAISEALDNDDFIAGAYILEVSSPGIERPLKKPTDFQRFAGKSVLVRLFAPLDGQKELTGELLGYGAEGVEIREKKSGKEYKIALEKISKAHLLFEF